MLQDLAEGLLSLPVLIMLCVYVVLAQKNAKDRQEFEERYPVVGACSFCEMRTSRRNDKIDCFDCGCLERVAAQDKES